VALPGGDLEWLFGEIAHAARTGQPLFAAMAELARAEAGTARGRATGRLAERMAAGNSLSAAIAADARSFPPGAAEAVEAGERSGRLFEALTALAESVAIEDKLTRKISGTLVYPLIIAIACSAVMLYLNATILPFFRDVYNDLNVELPYLTYHLPMIVLLTAIVAVFLPACVLAVLLLITVPWAYGRSLVDHLRILTPLVRRPVQHVLLSRWCAAAGPLFAAGAPEPQAVRLAGQAAGNAAVRKASERLAARLEAGEPLGQAMMREAFFPPALAWMVDASSRAGGHREVWPLLRGIYRDHARTETEVIGIFLGAGFIVVTVLLVALSALALMLPLIRCMNSLGG
jgi:type II secretory pathway component PulF